jgi:hypothetical protein
LHGDLRPPTAVLDQEMCVELQAARVRDQLDVVDADAAITPFPACDRPSLRSRRRVYQNGISGV